ncbi:MAG: transposase, partial [Lentisphaerales bacterium]|nr:transposase [Lentisphaerales bacterium]
QRVLQICSGYPDCNDGDSLKNDPALKVSVGRSVNDASLGSQPTLSRLDNSFNKADLIRMAYALEDNFLNSFSKEPETIIIDMDPTTER